jgi:hypothetical protein
MEPPNDQMSARAAMLESTSWDMPMPTGVLDCRMISVPPLSSSSQVDGPLGSPAFSHRLLR